MKTRFNRQGDVHTREQVGKVEWEFTCFLKKDDNNFTFKTEDVYCFSLMETTGMTSLKCPQKGYAEK